MLPLAPTHHRDETDLVVRVVASLIVALGRERDAAIVFMDDLWFRVEACEAAAVAALRR